jgi:hypothetical protein
MKSIKRIVLTIALTLTVASGLQAGCLSQFAQYIQVCEDYTSGFREAGCRADAVVEYYSCIGRAALG